MLKVARSFSKIMDKQKKSKLTLAAKLTKKSNPEIKKVSPAVKDEKNIEDMEDIVTSEKLLRCFSPLQTRSSRKNTQNFLADAKFEHVPSKISRMAVTGKKKAQAVLKSKVETTEVAPIKKEIIDKEEIIVKEEIIAKEDIKLEPAGADVSTEWAPSNWFSVLQNVREMRSMMPAPVDTMGCDQCADEETDEKTQRYHKLVSLMLSSQTRDECTFEAMKRLKKESLTPERILAIPENELQNLLQPVCFYRVKAKHLKQTAQVLVDKYNSDIPKTVKELVALPGVGPKMAHICMATAWNEITGIGVDVHVHRISNRLGWLPKPTKEPEQTRAALEKWLPRELWAEVNHLFVGFGQTICTPLRPNCGKCLNATICPAADKAAIAKALKNEVKKEHVRPDLEKFEKKKILKI